MTRSVEFGDAGTRVRFHSPEDPYRDGYDFRKFIVEIKAEGILAMSDVTNVEEVKPR